MPYSKSELGNVEFYKTFIDRLRVGYLKELKEFAEIGFRKDDVLYSSFQSHQYLVEIPYNNL